MIAIDKNYTTVVYSLGKCGTTSFTNALDEQWHYAGEENITWYNAKHADDRNRPMEQKEALYRAINEHNCSPVFIVREPWKRYVSGFKEILQDYISALVPTEEKFIVIWNDLMADADLLINYIDRLFYLSQFITNEQYRKEHEYNWGRNFSLHENYHTRNWLLMLNDFPGARIIDSNNLDQYITELGYTPKRDNTSNPQDINHLENALLNCGSYYLIEKFITPEIQRYNNLT